MANSKHYRALHDACQDAYLAGNTDFRALAKQFGICEKTVQNWMGKGRWRAMANEQRNLEQRADVARKRAIVKALEEFATNPKDVALQSLVSLLRNEQRRLEPIKELNDYIVKFLDQLTDFFIEKDYPGLLKEFQAIVYDLSEYIRVRNS